MPYVSEMALSEHFNRYMSQPRTSSDWAVMEHDYQEATRKDAAAALFQKHFLDVSEDEEDIVREIELNYDAVHNYWEKIEDRYDGDFKIKKWKYEDFHTNDDDLRIKNIRILKIFRMKTCERFQEICKFFSIKTNPCFMRKGQFDKYRCAPLKIKVDILTTVARNGKKYLTDSNMYHKNSVVYISCPICNQRTRWYSKMYCNKL